MAADSQLQRVPRIPRCRVYSVVDIRYTPVHVDCGVSVWCVVYKTRSGANPTGIDRPEGVIAELDECL